MSKPEIRQLGDFCSVSCQWPELFHPSRYNWINFDLIKCCFEYEKLTGCFEFELALFGLGLRLNIPIVRTEMMDEMSRMARLAEHGMLDTEDVTTTANGLNIKATSQAADVLAANPDLANEIVSALNETSVRKEK